MEGLNSPAKITQACQISTLLQTISIFGVGLKLPFLLEVEKK